mmetsp:Transcript_39743/g.35140  ORF Transcript_39743/g.35140 Transcript_39743/m.35140 type:complete len:158 (-) Transcript_39743:4-477(-)
MAAVKEKTVVVTKYDVSNKDVILEMDDKKFQIVEVKKKKEYVKTVYGPKQNKTDKAIIIPYKLQSKKEIGKIPTKFLKTKLKINNISMFMEIIDDDKDATATFEIGANREGWITRDYQKMTITARPIDSDSEKDQVQWSFEYPIKGGKLLTKTKEIK